MRDVKGSAYEAKVWDMFLLLTAHRPLLVFIIVALETKDTSSESCPVPIVANVRKYNHRSSHTPRSAEAN